MLTLNDDGNITAEDRDIIGNPFPKYSYSFNLGASWKNFDLSTFWQGVGGIYRYSWETSTDIRGNLTERWLDRYSAGNVNASMPALGNTMNDSIFFILVRKFQLLTFEESWNSAIHSASLDLTKTGCFQCPCLFCRKLTF